MKYSILILSITTLLCLGAGCSLEASADEFADDELLKQSLDLEGSSDKNSGLIDKAQDALENKEEEINNKAKSALQNIIKCDCPAEPQDCEDFLNQKDAQEVYECCLQVHGTDNHDLDPDHDGHACELLP